MAILGELNLRYSFFMSKCNVRLILMLCVIVIIVETLLLLMFGGFLTSVNPNLILQRGWMQNSHLSSCQYTDIIKEQQQLSCYLFLAVIVRPSGFDRRELIRRTWYKHFTDNNSLTQLRFFMGTNSLSRELLEKLHKEQERHNDIVMLDQLVDSYKNLTSKTVQTMKWTAQHVNFTYYLKCDDDSYPLLNPIISELQAHKQTGRLYWGHFFVYHHVLRSGKNIDNDWFLTNHYTPFAIGGAYILSSDLVHLIVGLENCIQYYQNEDVSVGLWLAPYQIERKHDYRFCRRSQTCLHNTIIFLGRSEEQILRLFYKS